MDETSENNEFPFATKGMDRMLEVVQQRGIGRAARTFGCAAGLSGLVFHTGLEFHSTCQRSSSDPDAGLQVRPHDLRAPPNWRKATT